MAVAARVVPAVPTFSVDDGFWYSIPESHRARVEIGSVVRIPLGGRRTRGYVVEIGERPPDRLKPISGISGDFPIFDRRLRDGLMWLAHHYVAPVAVALERAGPPNLSTRQDSRTGTERSTSSASHPLDAAVASIVKRRRQPPIALLSSWGDASWIGAMLPVFDAGLSAMVVVGTAAEVALVASVARTVVGEQVVVEVSGDMDDRAVTSAWSKAAGQAGLLVVGTPRIASWPVASLAVAVVVEEGRRSMKDRQTPTVAVRTLVTTRARVEGFAQVFVGPTPSLEVIASGATVVRPSARAWPLVEIADRREDPPGSGLVSQQVRQAIRGTADRGGQVFVFTHRRGYAPAYRCASCRELRRCETCGSRPEPGEACPRCGSPVGNCPHCGGASFEPLGAGVGRVLNELRGLLGDLVGTPEEERPVTVGSERDLAAIPGLDLAVAVDVDGLALGSHFRSSEEALRILARLAGRVRRGSGRRLILQTSMPDNPLLVALRRGDPMEFLRLELEHRTSMGYPPASEIVVIETRGPTATVEEDLATITDETVAVMGPALTHDSRRWLIQGSGLGGFKLALRPLVQRWRDNGVSVRIDVDPLDL